MIWFVAGFEWGFLAVLVGRWVLLRRAYTRNPGTRSDRAGNQPRNADARSVPVRASVARVPSRARRLLADRDCWVDLAVAGEARRDAPGAPVSGVVPVTP